MVDYRAPLNDVRFILKDQLKTIDLWQTMPELAEADAETADAILEEAAKLIEEVIAPLNREADEQGCEFIDGQVRSPEGFKHAYQSFCEAGWGALSGNPEYGGMGMPKSLVSAVEEMLQGGCMALGLAPMLTAGACLAIDTHANEALKALYLPKMYSGQWAGAMDLTEPHAGTDLGLIKTKAEPAADGSYRITGSKIFITWGEHDLAENIVHLVLAKLPGAAPGARGISMFLVPKFLPDDGGELGARNTVVCSSIEKKMGIKASATCVMNFDGATGWLVGEAGRGLAAMFTMMNYERLVVGIQGLGSAEVSYQNAVAYARDRLQSRSPSGAVNTDKSADPIMVHPDVRRMLMTMRAFNEGGRAFYIYVAQWLDIAKFSQDEAQRKQAENRVALLTPIAKAFLTDRALDTAVLGQQVFGGHGYIREWGQEQLVRDIRITQIYEGTNGIQAMDLAARKTVATEGQLLQGLLTEIETYLEQITLPQQLCPLAESLSLAIASCRAATEQMLKQTQADPSVAGSVAVDYLNMLGYLCLGYMWIKAAAVARDIDDSELAEAKIVTAGFYFERFMPEIDMLAGRVATGAKTTMALRSELF